MHAFENKYKRCYAFDILSLKFIQDELTEYEEKYIYNDVKRENKIKELIKKNQSDIDTLLNKPYNLRYFCNYDKIDELFISESEKRKDAGYKEVYVELRNVEKSKKIKHMIVNLIAFGIPIALIIYGLVSDVDDKWVKIVSGIFAIIYGLYLCVYNIVKTYDGEIITKNNPIRMFMVNYGFIEDEIPIGLIEHTEIRRFDNGSIKDKTTNVVDIEKYSHYTPKRKQC